jgi:signal peptidase II
LGWKQDWFQIYFVENEGMAWGWKFGGEWGKMALTLFRLVAVVFGIFYIRNIIKKKLHPGFIICVGLIFAGALGNLIDSMFYGLIFEESTYNDVARIFPAHGYAASCMVKWWICCISLLFKPITRLGSGCRREGI